ncbi:MAG: hypothetical protein KBT88_09435 [Gammaproteobacteria bacterium]|nr:hypothetical protein [Gammaproteobacteria bacterium]MBQ0839997.1 hypothetical protein [Gammaproteobacteria bacterium]
MLDNAENITTSNFRTTEEAVTCLIQSTGLTEINVSTTAFKQTCREYLRAQVALSKYNASLLRGGEMIGAKDYLAAEVEPKKPPTDTIRHTPRISEVLADFLIERQASRGLGKTAIDGYTASFKELAAILGDIEAGSIKNEQARQFRDTLLRLPKHHHKLL